MCSLSYFTYLLQAWGVRRELFRGTKDTRNDQVIRENPASRGTETSAEVLVGPPWRMESVNSSGARLTLALGGGLERSRDPPARQWRRTRSHPPPQSASEGIGGARGLGHLVKRSQ